MKNTDTSPNATYRNLLIDLHRAEVVYALLRDNVQAQNPIRDLDILVSEKQLHAFDNLAGKHGFFLIKDGYLNPHKRVYLKVEAGAPLILDVHTQIIFRGLIFMDGAKALAERERANGFYRLSPEAFLISLLFHNVLAKKRIQEKHLALLESLLQQTQNSQALHTHLDAFGLRAVFEELTEDFDRICREPALVGQLAQRAQATLLRKNLGNRLRKWQMSLRETKLKLFGKKRGIVITFLGPDGAGKSTTIDAIKTRLKEIGIGTKMAYLGPWGGSILNLKGLFSLLHLTPYRDDYKAYDKGRIAEKPGRLKGMKNVRFQLRSGLYYAFLLLEMLVRWFVLVMPLLRQGRVVLSDRYFYDILTGYKNKPIDYHVRLRHRLCALYPKPDLGIVLDASPEVIYARKPQLTEAQLQQSRQVYHGIARQFGFFVLDTSDSVEQTLNDFESQILPVLLGKLDGRKSGKAIKTGSKAVHTLEPATPDSV